MIEPLIIKTIPLPSIRHTIFFSFFEIKQQIFLMEFQKQAQRNRLTTLVHQINLMTSKVVELDPQNPEHYTIVNVNRDSNTSPINWTYADVVMGRIRFHQGRSPVGNVWGVAQQPSKPQPSAQARHEQFEAPTKISEVTMTKEMTANVRGRADNKATRDAREKAERNQSHTPHKDETEASRGAENVVRLHVSQEEARSLSPGPAEIYNVGFTDEEGKTYAEILKGMRDASGSFFTTQFTQNPEVARINAERTHHFIANEKLVGSPKPPPRKHKHASHKIVLKVDGAEQQSSAVQQPITHHQPVTDISGVADVEPRKKYKRGCAKRRHPEAVDADGNNTRKFRIQIPRTQAQAAKKRKSVAKSPRRSTTRRKRKSQMTIKVPKTPKQMV